MEKFDQDYTIHSVYHESVDEKRNIKKVGSSTSVFRFLCSIQADHFVPCSAVIHGLAENDKRMYEMYDQFGPTPRICFDYIKNPYARFCHRANRDKALESLSSVTFRQMVDKSKSLTVDSISHTLYS